MECWRVTPIPALPPLRGKVGIDAQWGEGISDAPLEMRNESVAG
jgi:hypothetical protein